MPASSNHGEPVIQEEDFFVVWSPQGGAPTHRHEYQHQALAEAERLASTKPGRDFIVLQAVAARRVDVPMQRTAYEPRIPF